MHMNIDWYLRSLLTTNIHFVVQLVKYFIKPTKEKQIPVEKKVPFVLKN
jgi:hypothetical protein